MDKEITINLSDFSSEIIVPYSTQIPLDINSSVNSIDNITIGVGNFPLFQSVGLTTLTPIIKTAVTIRLISQMLITTLDPQSLNSMDNKTIAELEIDRNELFKSIN